MNINSFNSGKLFLPNDIKLKILSFIAINDLTLKVSVVCQDFLRLTIDENLWRQETLRRFGQCVREKSCIIKQKSWKTLYILLHKDELRTRAEARARIQRNIAICRESLAAYDQSLAACDQAVIASYQALKNAEKTQQRAEEALAEIQRQSDLEKMIFSIPTKIFKTFMKFIQSQKRS